MKKLKIKVTKEILSRKMDCSGWKVLTNCAIALAVRELIPEAVVNELQIHDHYLNWEINLPQEATDFIRKFDKTPIEQKPYLPEFEFEVDLPDSFLETINIDEVKELLKDSKTLELV